MIVNQATAVSTPRILLVPYEAHHVPTYHEWMKDEQIQEATASEPLSLEEEYAMQRSWGTDSDKLTFIVCLPAVQARDSVLVDVDDAPDRMIGDVNLFLFEADEDPEGCIGEIELMIAPLTARRKGYGRATLLAFLQYIHRNLDTILEEYRTHQSQSSMRLLQLRVKIQSKNTASVNLFLSVGFVQVQEEENYFGEVELVLEAFLDWLPQVSLRGYSELAYQSPQPT